MAARRLVISMTFSIVILTALFIFIKPVVPNSKFDRNCRFDDMNIALVYDCRKNLLEQHDFFTELLLAVEKSSIKSLKPRRLYVSLMTYNSSGLVEVGKLSVRHDLSSRISELLEPLANTSNEKCPDSLPYEDVIGRTGRALNDSGKNTKKFALFVLYENITSKNSDSEVVESLTTLQSNDIEVGRLFIVITGKEKPEVSETFIIQSSMLNTSLEACLFRMCRMCKWDYKGYGYNNLCFYHVIFNVTQNMTAHESSKRCERISKESKMTSINSDKKMNFVYLLAAVYRRGLNEGAPALDDYPFNFFIGLQGVIVEGAKRYSWSDGNPMVLKPFWNPSPDNETCFYSSSKKLHVGGFLFDEKTWNETSCNETIPVQLLLCEKMMIPLRIESIGSVSLGSNSEQNKMYSFPESYLNLSSLNSNVTSSLLLSLLIKQGKQPSRSENGSCDGDERNSNDVVKHYFCHRYKPENPQTKFRTPHPGSGVTFQMYISNQSGLNNYLTYTFVSGSTVKPTNQTLKEDIHVNSDTNPASHLTNDTFEASTCKPQSDRLPIPKCVYDTDFRGRIIGCADNSHLQRCENFNCPHIYVKCHNSYCIPRQLLNNGVKDCPHGEDEHIKKAVVCYGNLTLALRDICIARSLYHSPGDKSEFLCQDQCAPGFACVSNIAGHFNSNETTFIYKNIEFQIFNKSNTFFLTPEVYFFFPFYQVVQMNLLGCKIDSLNQTFANFDIEGIISLDISKTSIGLGTAHLRNLRLLNASRHKNTSNIVFPPSLEVIDLSNTKVSQSVILKMSNLTHLRKLLLRGIKGLNLGIEANATLEVLDLRESRLEGLKDGYLNWLSIQSALYADDFRICCDVIRGERIPEEKCHARVDAISTCHDLIGHPVKRVILWAVCVAAIVGNLVVVTYKAVWDRAVLSKAYGVFVACLGGSDLIMGVYLLIIAGADIHYRSLYVLEDSNWREGNVCKLAGVLSTFSSQTSTLFIFLITLDRYLYVRYSFGEHRISKRGKMISILLVLFVGAAAAIVPVIVPRWKIYSSNALCLALPFRARWHRGWQYSTVLYVGVNFVLFLLIAVGQVLIFRSFLSKSITAFSSVRRSTRRLQESIAKQLFLVTLSNFCCWFPVCVMGIASVFGPQFNREMYAWSAVLILPINSAINPLIYTLPAVYKKIQSACRA